MGATADGQRLAGGRWLRRLRHPKICRIMSLVERPAVSRWFDAFTGLPSRHSRSREVMLKGESW
jgi:hypothetical protein